MSTNTIDWGLSQRALTAIMAPLGEEEKKSLTESCLANTALLRRRIDKQQAKISRGGAAPNSEQTLSATMKGIEKTIIQLMETCANPTCETGKEPATFKKCGGCKKVMYCGPDCQRSHWLEHKKVCVQRPQEENK